MAQITRRLHLRHYHSDTRWSPHNFTYPGETGVDPWFMEPVFNAVRNTRESVNSLGYMPAIVSRLGQDAKFIARAADFCQENNQPFTSDTVARLVRTYLTVIPQDEDLEASPFHPRRLGSYMKPLYHLPGSREGYFYKVAEGEQPWFMKPVFEAFADAARENPGKITKITDAYDVVLQRLRNDEAFVARVHAFYEENELLVDARAVERILATYCYRMPNDPQFYRGEYGNERLKAVFENLKPRPYPQEDVERVAHHLRLVLTQGKFQSLPVAIPAVIRSMQDHGEPVLGEKKIRTIIRHESSRDPQWHKTMGAHLDVDHRDEGHEGEGALATSFSRPAGPTGPIGSTHPARRGPG